MIKKIICSFLLLILLPTNVNAQENSWQIKSFNSEITINQDTSISVQETISVDFGALQKRGIFRDIPYLYTNDGRSLKTEISNVNVTDENGVPYQFNKERHSQSLQLRIGDPDVYVSGENTYIINYTVDDAIKIYVENPELYWNVTGSEWEAPILQASAKVNSKFAEIVKVECFEGLVGANNFCQNSASSDLATFQTSSPLTFDEDFTIVVQLNSTNQLAFPSQMEQIHDLIIENLGYPIALFPTFFIALMWWKRGRDRSYISEVYYYKPTDKAERQAPIFPRMSLPLTYSPINGLTPSEVGTLIDEKVHIEDIIAEIMELGRLGYIKIHTIGKKKLFKQQEFAFEKLKEADDKLEPHQKIILDEIFNYSATVNSLKKMSSFFKEAEKKEIEKKMAMGNYVIFSTLANKFYTSLPKIKEAIYKQLQSKSLFYSNPETTKILWTGKLITINFFAGILLLLFINTYQNIFPFILMLILFPFGLIFALSMPRRTAWGYSLFQQTLALREYIKVGKWRHEIAEKHLFLDEMLPLAISLGVVNKLAKDMDELNVKTPSYLQGATAGSFYSSYYTSLNSALTRNMTSSPSGASSGGFSTSGRSSWSGGSGFSGGSSGGGFGGGGGGSW